MSTPESPILVPYSRASTVQSVSAVIDGALSAVVATVVVTPRAASPASTTTAYLSPSGSETQIIEWPAIEDVGTLAERYSDSVRGGEGGMPTLELIVSEWDRLIAPVVDSMDMGDVDILLDLREELFREAGPFRAPFTGPLRWPTGDKTIHLPGRPATPENWNWVSDGIWAPPVLHEHGKHWQETEAGVSPTDISPMPIVVDISANDTDEDVIVADWEPITSTLGVTPGTEAPASPEIMGLDRVSSMSTDESESDTDCYDGDVSA